MKVLKFGVADTPFIEGGRFQMRVPVEMRDFMSVAIEDDDLVIYGLGEAYGPSETREFFVARTGSDELPSGPWKYIGTCTRTLPNNATVKHTVHVYVLSKSTGTQRFEKEERTLIAVGKDWIRPKHVVAIGVFILVIAFILIAITG